MGDIYAKATGVAVWLGEHDETSRMALPIIYKIGSEFERLTPLELKVLESRPLIDDPSIFALLEMKPIGEPEWKYIVGFFSRTWFGRVWIAQEIVLAQKAILLCGDNDVDYREVINFVQFLGITAWDQLFTSAPRKDAERFPPR